MLRILAASIYPFFNQAPLSPQARIVKNWSMVCDDFGAQIRDALLKHNSAQRANELKELLAAA